MLKFVILVPSRCHSKSGKPLTFKCTTAQTYRGVFCEDFLPIVKEVLVEGLVLRVIRLYHGGIEACDFFRGWRKVYILPYETLASDQYQHK